MEEKFCKICGAPLEDGQKFCTNCGAIVSSGADIPNAQPQPEDTVSPFDTPQQTLEQPQQTYSQPQYYVQPVEVAPKRTSTAFKGLYIPSKILGIISLINSIFNIILVLCIFLAVVGATVSQPSGIGSDELDALCFALAYLSVCTFISLIVSLVMSIISISLGGKIKRRDPNDLGANVARPAKIALVFTIISFVALFAIAAYIIGAGIFKFDLNSLNSLEYLD